MLLLLLQRLLLVQTLRTWLLLLRWLLHLLLLPTDVRASRHPCLTLLLLLLLVVGQRTAVSRSSNLSIPSNTPPFLFVPLLCIQPAVDLLRIQPDNARRRIDAGVRLEPPERCRCCQPRHRTRNIQPMRSCSNAGLTGREGCCVPREISAQKIIAKIVDIPAAHHPPAPAAPTSSSSSSGQAGCSWLPVRTEQGAASSRSCCCWTAEGHEQLFAADVFFVIAVN
jgi:hypothetical protein